MKKILFRGLCLLTILSVFGVAYVVVDYCSNSITNSEYSSIEPDNNNNSFDSNKNEFSDKKENKSLEQ